MEYEELRLLKKSEKSTVHLVREKGGTGLYIRKKLAGQHPVYQMLKEYSHPCLPKLREVTVSDEDTVVIEEYIEEQISGRENLSGKQFRKIVRELCSVLEFLHGKGIIHRDIKPSNLILTEDCHVYLIDFDAARMPREGAEQDTRLLGTRGFAPPEQYGFSQTDERADIYSLGVTLEKLLGDGIRKPRYLRILRKCQNLDPEKRYQSVAEVRRAFFPEERKGLWGAAALVLAALLGMGTVGFSALNSNVGTELTVLETPGNPHWDRETGIVSWNNVLESGVADEVQFRLRLYRRDTASVPDVEDVDWYEEELVRIGGSSRDMETIIWNVVPKLKNNGFYYFTVAAVGDGLRYTDSPYVVSDVFEYTGEEAPLLKSPTGLAWRLFESDDTRYYCATWDNLDDYEDDDFFNVTFYDETDTYVMNNTWSKEAIIRFGKGGITIPTEFLISGTGKAYRFTVQVYSSRPNEYRSSPMPDPVPEEYFSPWLTFGPKE